MIQIGIDKRCADVITVDAKSYVMKGHDGKITKKGQTLRGRNSEAFLNGLKDVFIKHIFDKNPQACVEHYEGIRRKIAQRRLKPEDIQQKAQLNISLEEYRRKIEAGANKSAVYELALNATDKRYQKGDQIRYYVCDPGDETVTIRGKQVTRKRKVNKSESSMMIEDYCYDYDVDHYILRLDKATKILILVYGLEKFKELFPTIKIRKEDTDKLDKRETKLRAVKTLIDGDLQ